MIWALCLVELKWGVDKMENEIIITCKGCGDTFTFGTSNAVENATFCNRKCEEEAIFYDYEEEEDTSMDMTEHELNNEGFTHPDQLPEIGIIYVVVDLKRPLSMGFACMDKEQTKEWVDRTNELLGYDRFFITKRKLVDANILQCENNL